VILLLFKIHCKTVIAFRKLVEFLISVGHNMEELLKLELFVEDGRSVVYYGQVLGGILAKYSWVDP